MFLCNCLDVDLFLVMKIEIIVDEKVGLGVEQKCMRNSLSNEHK